jgi:nucleotide-binding universal stress UspA family protein
MWEVAMSDVILVVLGRPEMAHAVLSGATCLASLMGGAHLNVLAVQEPVHVHVLEAEALITDADAILAVREGDKRRVETLKAIFDRWIVGLGEAVANARWVAVEGSAATIIGERGSRADIIVTEQPVDGDRAAKQVIRAALFATGRPVLVIPPGTATPFGRKIAIAWRDEKQAVRAVIPALRWLAGGAQLHVLMGVHDDGTRRDMPSIFREHGIRAELHLLPTTPRPFGRTMLAKLHQLGAELLVMGAYAHSPLRELILGGMTRYMLDHADLPVLMRH